MANFLKKLLPSRLKALLKRISNRDRIESYSQFGEDAFIRSYFVGKHWEKGKLSRIPSNGFYVDVGSYSPTECSNTFAFYQSGWRGINIDATPGVKEMFDLVRSKDTNLQCAVGSSERELRLYSWGVPNVFNTADEMLAKKRAIDLGEEPSCISVPCRTLEQILDSHLPEKTGIDFLSVDVEGMDLEVLRSNNWVRYRPELVVAEDYASSLEELTASDIYRYMIEQRYQCIGWLRPSAIFLDTESRNIDAPG